MRTRNRSVSSVANRSTGATRVRAAASSSASGMPSRRRQISATAPAFASVSRKPARARCARATNRRTASEADRSATEATSSVGVVSDGTRQTVSAVVPKGSRLVASTVTDGQARARRSTTTARRVDDVLAVVEHEQRPFVGEGADRLGPAPARPSTRGCRARSRWPRPPDHLGRSAPARPTTRRRRRRRRHRAPTCWAKRVLPTPPGPVSVTTRRSVVAEEQGDGGQLVDPADERRQRDRQVRGRSRRGRRAAGTSVAGPGATSCHTSSGRSRSRSR